MKILIIKTSSLGDIVHCNPIIRDMHQNLSNLEIHWLVEDVFSSLINIFPINKVLISNFRSWKKNPLSIRSVAEIFKLKKLIKSEMYDAVIDCQGLLRSGLLCSGTNSSGYNKNSIKESLASFFYKNKVDLSKKLHAIDRNRLLVAKVLGYSINLDTPGFSLNIKPINEIKNQILFVTGTSNDKKKWSLTKWVELAKIFETENTKIQLIWGNMKEYEDCLAIYDKTTNTTILPKKSIDKLAEEISFSKLVIGVDSGITHLASALGIPTVCIFKHSFPELTGLKSQEKLSANVGNYNSDPSLEDVLKKIQEIA